MGAVAGACGWQGNGIAGRVAPGMAQCGGGRHLHSGWMPVHPVAASRYGPDNGEGGSLAR